MPLPFHILLNRARVDLALLRRKEGAELEKAKRSVRVWLVVDDGMKGPIRLKLSPHREVWFEVGWEEVWLEVEEDIQPVIQDGGDVRQGRAKVGEVQIEVRGRLGGNVAQVGGSLV